jgi:hypothetical protein
MKHKRIYVLLGFCSICLAVALFQYISRTETSPFYGRIAEADRIVAKGGYPLLPDGRRGERLVITLSGNEVSEVKQAIASAKKSGIYSSNKLLTEVSFYRGTNFLGKMLSSGNNFGPWISGESMHYNAKGLEALIDRPLSDLARIRTKLPGSNATEENAVQPLGPKAN